MRHEQACKYHEERNGVEEKSFELYHLFMYWCGEMEFLFRVAAGICRLTLPEEVEKVNSAAPR